MIQRLFLFLASKSIGGFRRRKESSLCEKVFRTDVGQNHLLSVFFQSEKKKAILLDGFQLLGYLWV